MRGVVKINLGLVQKGPLEGLEGPYDGVEVELVRHRDERRLGRVSVRVHGLPVRARVVPVERAEVVGGVEPLEAPLHAARLGVRFVVDRQVVVPSIARLHVRVSVDGSWGDWGNEYFFTLFVFDL